MIDTYIIMYACIHSRSLVGKHHLVDYRDWG